MSKVYFWQPVLTEHAVHTFSAAARAMGREPHWIAAKAELAERKQQGWSSIGDLVPIEFLDASGWRRRVDEILSSDGDDLHIFGSPFERGIIHSALRKAAAARKQVYLVSEPYAPRAVGYFRSNAVRDWVKGMLRPLVYARHARRLRGRVQGIFAISPLAVRQFKQLGITDDAIFPFGYFVPRLGALSGETDKARRADRALRCAFVGALIPRKGVATAIAAVAALGDKHNVTLDLYGPGNVTAYGTLPPKIVYRGSIEFGGAQTVLLDYDVLLVPSLHDGWGVVVNEGILAGCAVIASYETGASALVNHFGCGAIFTAGNTDALGAAIARFADNPDLLDSARRAARLFREKLSPEVAGAYMARCIRSVNRLTPPEPSPWY